MNKILDEFEFSYLRKLKSFGYQAVIAGGSVRDMVKKVPYKDVDFFIFYQPNFNLGRFFDEEVQEIFNTDFEIKAPGMFDASFNPQTPTIAIGNGDISGHLFQLVVVNTSLNIMIKNQFDLNCCKVWHDGNAMYTTKAFKEFLKTGVIETTFPKERVTTLTIERAKKFAEKLNCNLGSSILEAEAYKKKRKISTNYIKFTRELVEPLGPEPLWIDDHGDPDAPQG